jgi:hypothetical protein
MNERDCSLDSSEVPLTFSKDFKRPMRRPCGAEAPLHGDLFGWAIKMYR